MEGMSMRNGITVAVVGAIVLVVMFAVLPTIFGAMGNTFNLTSASCLAGGERFTAVIAKGTHTTADDAWNSTTTPMVVAASGTDCVGTAALTAAYTPQGQNAVVDSSPFGVSVNGTDGEWVAPLSIVQENLGINRLVLSALPVLAIVGVFIPLVMWWRGRGGGM